MSETTLSQMFGDVWLILFFCVRFSIQSLTADLLCSPSLSGSPFLCSPVRRVIGPLCSEGGLCSLRHIWNTNRSSANSQRIDFFERYPAVVMKDAGPFLQVSKTRSLWQDKCSRPLAEHVSTVSDTPLSAFSQQNQANARLWIRCLMHFYLQVCF